MGIASELAKPQEVLSAPKVALQTAKNKPWLAFGVLVVTVVFVTLLEAYKPGILTGPIRRGLQKLGLVKGA